MKEFKKLFSDTAITTTLLLKKCVKVKKFQQKSELIKGGLASKDYIKKIEQ
tara:strand:- start:102 stop:254 length:153 start_codon:yes stop_codon:yes gene_type:complete